MKHLISPLDLSVDELDHILALGQSIMHDPQAYAHVCAVSYTHLTLPTNSRV